MKFPGLFRILKRLRDLEVLTRELKAIAHEPVNAVEIAANVASELIATHESKTVPCSRCGAVVDLRMRKDGPRLMETGVDGSKQTIVGCNECQPYLKRFGFKVVDAKAKAEAKAPALTLVPKETEEVPA